MLHCFPHPCCLCIWKVLRFSPMFENCRLQFSAPKHDYVFCWCPWSPNRWNRKNHVFQTTGVKPCRSASIYFNLFHDWPTISTNIYIYVYIYYLYIYIYILYVYIYIICIYILCIYICINMYKWHRYGMCPPLIDHLPNRKPNPNPHVPFSGPDGFPCSSQTSCTAT